MFSRTLNEVRIERLRNTTIHELRVRGAQAYAVLMERLSWSYLTRLPTDLQLLSLLKKKNGEGDEPRLLNSFLDSFRAGDEGEFFSGFADQNSTVSILRSRWPEAEKEIIKQADKFSSGKFDLLGLKDLTFGNPIDWHLEPVSGKTSPLVHWSHLDFLDAEVAGDKKITWELNRHQYFITFGQAYWLTGDEKYAQTFVAQLESWLSRNPPKVGINWASSLEIAFRSISWLWGMHFFKESPALPNGTLLEAIKYLYLNARHLETYLSTYFSPNTHLTGEALGLFYLGTLLPQFKEAERWRSKGREILLNQLSRHVQPDGVYFEQSSYYHRYTADFYLHFLILCRQNGCSVPEEVEANLQLLLEHLMFIMRPDGTTPFFGDDDGGRLVKLDRRSAADFRATLSTGAAIFGRRDFKFAAGEIAEETLWLLGSEGVDKFESLKAQTPSRQSAAFESSGYFVMRDGWTREANYFLMDCGPHGWSNCGHAHADALSFELVSRGQSFLVDPGTFTYTGSQELRDWFRSSVAHNTLTVDRQSSSEPAGPFSWNTVARSQLLSWLQRNRFDYIKAEHDGYLRLADPVTHCRSVFFLKNDYWVMRDITGSTGEHTLDLWFHFAPGFTTQLSVSDGQLPQLIAANGRSGLKLVAATANGAWHSHEGWVSPCYANKVVAPVYSFTVTGSGRREFLTFLLPYESGAETPLVRELETSEGRAFEVFHEATSDLVMITDGGSVRARGLASDFEWTWARFPNEGGDLPDELIVMNGRSLVVAGKSVLDSENPIKCAQLQRVQNRFEITEIEV